MSSKIPPSNLVFFNKSETIQVNPDQKNSKYNVKYILVIVLLINGCFSKKLKSKKAPKTKVIKAKAISCLIN